MSNMYGRYTWWPKLYTLEFTPRGKRSYLFVGILSKDKNNERHALAEAMKHTLKLLKE